MNTIEFMYVYYDRLGNIKAISPQANYYKENEFYMALLPLHEVEGFLSGKKNPSDFIIKRKELPLTTEHKLVRKKSLDITHTRKLDSYLTEVSTTEPLDTASIIIQNSIKNQIITIVLGASFENILNEGQPEEIESFINSINFPSIPLYFTAEHDPYFLKHIFNFSPTELLENKLIAKKYSVDLSNSSVYTRQIISGFRYIIT